MSLAQLWAVLKAARWSILLMVLAAVGVSLAISSSLPKQYTAKARVMLNVGSSDPTQSLILRGDAQGAYIATQIKLVTDPAVMRDVVVKLGWPDNPQVIAGWQAATGGTGDVADWAAGIIAGNTFAHELEDSSIVEIFYVAPSLDLAKQIVAVIRQSFIDQSQRVRADAARRASAWNRTQAASELMALRRAETLRAQFMTANAIPVDTPSGGLDYTAEATALAATTASVKVRATGASDGGDSPQVAALRRRLDAIDAELPVLAERGEANPATVAMRAERETVKDQLARETAIAQAGGDVTDDQMAAVRRTRDNDLLQARMQLLSRAPLFDALAQLDRDVALKTRRYTAAAAHVAEFETIATAPSGLHVIGDVIGTEQPSFPNIPLSAAIAGGASLALAVALAVVGELTARRVRGAEDMRFYAKVPLLAVIAADPPRRRWWRIGRARRRAVALPV